MEGTWIPITEAMPDPGQKVLISDRENVNVGKYVRQTSSYWEEVNKNTKKRVTENTSYWDCDCEPWVDVTHWQPMPKPPEAD